LSVPNKKKIFLPLTDDHSVFLDYDTGNTVFAKRQKDGHYVETKENISFVPPETGYHIMCDPSKDVFHILQTLRTGYVPTYNRYRTVHCIVFETNKTFVNPIMDDTVYDLVVPVYLVNRFTGSRERLFFKVRFEKVETLYGDVVETSTDMNKEYTQAELETSFGTLRSNTTLKVGETLYKPTMVVTSQANDDKHSDEEFIRMILGRPNLTFRE